MPDSNCPHYPDIADIKKDAGPESADQAQMTGTHLKEWRCLITAIGGDESWRGRGLEAHVDFVVEGLFVDGVKEAMQLAVVSGRGMFDGLTLKITSARPKWVSNSQRLELYCTN